MSRALPLFVVITFAITWGVVGFYIAFPDQAVSWFGEISGEHPLFFLATWAPAITGFGLVLVYGGLAGFRALLSRLLLWRCEPARVVFVLIGLPLVFVVGSLIKGGPFLASSPDGPGSMVAVLMMMLFLGPIEEFGWRGVAQPLLQRHVAPI